MSNLPRLTGATDELLGKCQEAVLLAHNNLVRLRSYVSRDHQPTRIAEVICTLATAQQHAATALERIANEAMREAKP